MGDKKSNSEIISEAIKEPLDTIFNNLPKVDEFVRIHSILNKPESLVEEIFSRYFDIVEPGGCERDKARYVTKRLFRALKEKQHLTLQVTRRDVYGDLCKDNPDDLCYFCPCTLSDTKEAFDALMKLISIRFLPSFLEEQNKKFEPFLRKRIEDNKKYYLNRLNNTKKASGEVSLEELINHYITEYPKADIHIHVLNNSTGTVECFYDSLVEYKLIDNIGVRKKKILRINEEKFVHGNERTFISTDVVLED